MQETTMALKHQDVNISRISALLEICVLTSPELPLTGFM